MIKLTEEAKQRSEIGQKLGQKPKKKFMLIFDRKLNFFEINNYGQNNYFC